MGLETHMAKGKAPTAKQVAAGKANLARGRQTKQTMAEKAKAAGRETRADRWARLLDGSLTVRDLDDEEIANMQVRAADGTFGGKRRNSIPSHLAQQMRAESVRRANDMLRTAGPKAVKRLLEIAEDPDTKDTDAIRALALVMERALGKVPDKVIVEGVDRWGQTLNDVTDVAVDRDLEPDDA
jgi:plasmid stability protein